MTAPRFFSAEYLRRPGVLLILLSAGMPLAFNTWMALINNFAVERAAFTGVEMGILQSLREIPGFLTFTIVFALFLMREQTLMWLSLALLGFGVALTGFFPSVLGLYAVTVLMSVGFHYFESAKDSLAVQWIEPAKLPETLGRLLSAGSFAGLLVYGLIFLAPQWMTIKMETMFFIGGGACLVLALAAAVLFPRFPAPAEQHKKLLLRRRYWLYYALEFMSGARRQIFIVFAPFMMVETFGLDYVWVSALMGANLAVTMVIAPAVGRMVARFGERAALTFEYIGLVGVFTAYAFVDDVAVAAGLYVLDHVFFALAIAIRSYFGKIAAPADVAATTGVSFTISHIAAVVLPAVYGFIWIQSPSAVFLSAAAMAGVSLVLARFVPRNPGPGNETVLAARPAPQAAE
ncbi:MAG: MFS transporter [Rhodospirillales bacterium]